MLMETRAERSFRTIETDTYRKVELMGKANNQKSKTPSAVLQSDEKPDDNILERSKYVYEQINGWITNADDKVSVSCGIFAGAFGVISFLAEQHIKTPDNPVVDEFWKTI